MKNKRTYQGAYYENLDKLGKYYENIYKLAGFDIANVTLEYMGMYYSGNYPEQGLNFKCKHDKKTDIFTGVICGEESKSLLFDASYKDGYLIGLFTPFEELSSWVNKLPDALIFTPESVEKMSKNLKSGIIFGEQI